MKRIAVLLVAVSMIVTLPIVALAHPGRTDSSGGHTDHSTGEYHYHHGYPAHDHYDIDGDGRPDCPYNFQDRTSQNSGSSGNSTNSGNSATSSPPRSTITATNVSEPEKEEEEVPAWVYWVFGGMLVAILYLIASVIAKDDKICRLGGDIRDLKYRCESYENNIKKQKTHYENEIALMTQNYSHRIDYLKKESDRKNSLVVEEHRKMLESKIAPYESKYKFLKEVADSMLQENEMLKKQSHAVVFDHSKGESHFPTSPVTGLYAKSIMIPDEVYFTEDYTPVAGNVSGLLPYGSFTVFVADNGKVYHAYSHCGSAFLRVAHIYEVANTRRPCTKCGARHCDGVPSWYKEIKQITTSKAFKDYIAKSKE